MALLPRRGPGHPSTLTMLPGLPKSTLLPGDAPALLSVTLSKQRGHAGSEGDFTGLSLLTR